MLYRVKKELSSIFSVFFVLKDWSILSDSYWKKTDGLSRRADGKMSVCSKHMISSLLPGNCLSLFLFYQFEGGKTQFKERKCLTITRQKTTHSIVVWTKRGFNFVVLLNELVNLFPVQSLKTEQSPSTLQKNLSMILSLYCLNFCKVTRLIDGLEGEPKQHDTTE